jgi:hypothetical protein
MQHWINSASCLRHPAAKLEIDIQPKAPSNLVIMLFSRALLESNLMRAATRAKGNGTHTRGSILKTLGDHREEVRRFGVRSLGLFGSAVRGEATATSDLDFVVEFENPSFDSYMDLLEYLEKLFGQPVDLVLASTLKPRLRESILRETVHAPGL